MLSGVSHSPPGSLPNAWRASQTAQPGREKAPDIAGAMRGRRKARKPHGVFHGNVNSVNCEARFEGLASHIQGANTVGNADLEVLGIPIAGVSSIQKGGVLECERMTLKGEPTREVATADQAILRRASRLNDEAKKLLGEKRADDALVKMGEASALFVKVHGENHPDSANSFANRASILGATGKKEAAGKLWEKDLVIHESTLGPTHPHTTLTRFNLGKCYFEQGNKPKAKELWTRCCDDSREVLGSGYSLVRSLDLMLPRM